MPYQITPEDEKTLAFLMKDASGPVGQFQQMASQRGLNEPASSVTDRFSAGGKLDPRTYALLTRLAQMREPKIADANSL
jgi:hypothetical protein